MSTPSQFLHVSLYGVSPRKGEPRWATIAGITQEGARAPGAARHVPYPAEPTLIFGISPLEAGRIATERAGLARDSLGRRLRCDGAVLAAAVLSYPVPRALIDDRDAPDVADLYSAWRHSALAWCRQHFGDALLSVVEHSDEDYIHLHAYAVPDVGPAGQLRWEAIHPGRAALTRSDEENKGKSEQRAAYREAMTALQDDYHERVGILFGHARLGPKRTRVERTIHLAKRDLERHRSNLDQDFAVREAELRESLAAEIRQAFATKLMLAQQRIDELTAAQAADQLRIATLVDECNTLQDEITATLDDLGPGVGR